VVAPLVCVRPPGWISGDSGFTMGGLIEWAQRAENLGFDGIFVGDRLLAEASTQGGAVYDASMLDPVVTLSAIAASTQRILIGPLVFVVPFRHPIQIAKWVASLDVLSNGRVVLGAGVGWNDREFDALGISRSTRAARFEEALQSARDLWCGRAVHQESGFYPFAELKIAPASPRPGGPPVWMASFSPGDQFDWKGRLPDGAHRVLDRVGRLADGWVPLIYSASGRRRLDAEILGQAWHEVIAAARRYGRDRASIRFVLSDWCYVRTDSGSDRRCQEALATFFPGDWADARRTYSIGEADEVVDQLKRIATEIDHVDAYILTPLSNEVEQLEALAEKVTPHLRG
jgi:probable F420-dependent oxidoreductase